MSTTDTAAVRVAVTDTPVPLPAGMAFALPLRQKPTAAGVLWYRECPVPLYCQSEWISIWRTRKLDFLRRGFSVRQYDGKWYLQQWLSGNPGAHTLTARSLELIEAFTAPRQPTLGVVETVQPELVLPPLPNGLEDKLYDYQRQPARQLLRAILNGKQEYGYPGAWDCSDLGTGKTYQAAAAAIASGLEVGVICPKAVIGTPPRNGSGGTGWTGAFAHFQQKPLFVMNYESLRTGRREWIVRKGDRFEWTCDPQHTILVWDEAHNVKNKSLNRSMMFAAARQGFPMICISGTMAQSPLHMGATGIVVGLHNGTRDGYERFLLANGCQKYGPGTYEFPKGKRGAPYLAALHRRVFPLRGARVRIEDLGDRFPETQILCEPVATEATAEIAEAWDSATDTLRRLKEQGTVTEQQAKFMQNAAYMEAWHESERAKVSTIAAMVREEIEHGRSVAVFVNFTDVREALMKELKTSCAIFGGQPQHYRDKCIQQFQSDESRIIISNTAAGGVGISLHDVNGDYPRTAILLPTNNAVHLGQAFGRVHRAGGKSRSRQIVLFAADTIEEEICAQTRLKLASIATLNDGDLCPPPVF